MCACVGESFFSQERDGGGAPELHADAPSVRTLGASPSVDLKENLHNSEVLFKKEIG